MTAPKTRKPYIGELYQRSDGLWASRIRAANQHIVGTDGSQGYERQRAAQATLTRVLLHGPHTVYDEHDAVVPAPPTTRFAALAAKLRRRYTGHVVPRPDGRWEWQVRSGNHIVFVSHNQGYERADAALAVLTHLLHGGPHELR